MLPQLYWVCMKQLRKYQQAINGAVSMFLSGGEVRGQVHATTVDIPLYEEDTNAFL